jgi:hypothetical protein
MLRSSALGGLSAVTVSPVLPSLTVTFQLLFDLASTTPASLSSMLIGIRIKLDRCCELARRDYEDH